MFDRIAGRYDFLNRLLSFRRDVAWRNRLGRSLPLGGALRILDLATGTADVLIGLYQKTGRVASGFGLDLSANMLRHGQAKLRAKNLAGPLALIHGDAAAIGLAEGSVDAVTMAFGIRNVESAQTVLIEMHRVLRAGGRALILEFSLPGNEWFRALYLLYFRHMLPVVGGLVSGDGMAYKYLNESVERFPQGEVFEKMMVDAGFRDVNSVPLSLGIATLYQGDKQA